MTLEALIARLRAGGQVSTAEVLPLLQELQRRADEGTAERIIGKAFDVARMWRGQGSINRTLLDELAAEAFGVA